MTGVPYKKILGHTYTQTEDNVRTQGEDDHLRAKVRGLNRNQPFRHLDLNFWSPNCEDINFYCFNHPVFCTSVTAALAN